MDTVAALVTRFRRALELLDGLRVVYLFGSRARGTAREDSDFDVAVVFDPALNGAGREEARRDILDALEAAGAAPAVDLDVVDLDRTDSDVAFRAVTEGRLVLSRTPEERVRTEVTIGRRYDDDAPKRRLFVAAARRVAAEWAKNG